MAIVGGVTTTVRGRRRDSFAGEGPPLACVIVMSGGRLLRMSKSKMSGGGPVRRPPLTQVSHQRNEHELMIGCEDVRPLILGTQPALLVGPCGGSAC